MLAWPQVGSGAVVPLESMVGLAACVAAGWLATAMAAAETTWTVSAERLPRVETVPPVSPPVEFAVAELARYLGLILGKPLSVNRAPPGEPRIVLETVADPPAGEARPYGGKALGDEGYEISAEKHTLRIRGGDALGVVHGVYEFLRRYGGCRFSGIGPEGELVPSRQRITVEGLPLRIKPKLWYRGLQLSHGEDTPLTVQWIDWMAKNGFNYVTYRASSEEWLKWFEESVRPEMLRRGLKFDMGHHNLHFWLPARRHFAEHPDWFPMVDGKRVAATNQLGICSSNPRAVQTVIDNVRAYLRGHPEVSIVGVIPGDGYGLCHCEGCTKLDVENGIDPKEQFRQIPGDWRTGGKGSNLAKTRRYTLLVNQVARAVRDEFPGVRVGSAAYVDLTWPDREIRMEPNVVTWVAMYWRDGSRPLAEDSATDVNRAFFAALKDWRKLHPGRLITYSYYMGMNAQASLPYPQDRVIPKEWANLKALGIEGATLQNWPSNHEIYALNLLAFARSAWHDNVDSDALLDEYLDGMYGSAGREIKPIFDGFHEAWRRLEEAGTIVLPNGRSIVFLMETLGEARLDECLRRAREKAANDRERRQVEKLTSAAKYWKMAAEVFRLEQQAQAAKSTDKPAAKALNERAASQCQAILDYVKHLPPGWAAVTLPGVWDKAKKRLQAAASAS